MGVPIVYQGTAEARRLLDQAADPHSTPPAGYVWVGRWRSQHIDGGAGYGPQAMGMLIVATCNYDEVFRRCLHASKTIYEPETRNKIGGLGAYRELPPAQETIEATIAQAVATVERYLAAGHTAGYCDCALCQR